jgi:hypothetical protein
MVLRSIKALACCALILATTGCQPGCRVRLSGSAKALSIQIIDGALLHFGPPPISGLEVRSLSEERASWSINAPDRGCRPISSLLYGQTPPSFVANGRATLLKEGETYAVDVFGCGRTGGGWFRVSHGQIEQITNPAAH